MNNQHLLDSFLETVLEPDKETINYYGVEVPFPSLAQAELDRQFNINLKNNVSPRDFEKVIDGVIVSIKLDLKKKYKLYYFLLYNDELKSGNCDKARLGFLGYYFSCF